MLSDITAFLNLILSRIDFGNIRQSYGVTKKTMVPLERTWQMEFYTTAILCTPKDYIVSPDVGSLFRSTGSIDFTIHKSSLIFWGLELLREGDRIEEHVCCFGVTL